MRREPLRDRDLETTRRLGRVVEVGQRHTRQRLANGAFDVLEVGFFLARDEGKGLARLFRARGASHAVDIVLGRHRHIEVHDVAEFLDVDPARRDVRRNEHAIGAVLEPRERVSALRL